MSSPDPSRIVPALLAWWDAHGRHDLPWQQQPTPYRVWVSEIMLQQTQVATVLRYYPRFMADFPDVVALADAPLDHVLHRWSGLGYYARARHLHRAAGIVRDVHGGGVPTDFAALAALPGIGRSTAGAILALATGARHAILDGNVRRVLSRVFMVEGHAGQAAVLRRLWALAEACTPAARVADYTQAIMDLGAGPCARRRPACADCPLEAQCAARAAGATARLPAAKPRRVRPSRCTVLVLARRADGAVLLERRPPSGLWGGLWGLPALDAPDAVGDWCAARFGGPPATLTRLPVLHHAFTHFDLAITPIEARLGAHPGAPDGEYLWYDPRRPAEVGLAAPVARLLASVAGDAAGAPPARAGMRRVVVAR